MEGDMRGDEYKRMVDFLKLTDDMAVSAGDDFMRYLVDMALRHGISQQQRIDCGTLPEELLPKKLH
jgi:hypothetical protein